MSPPNHLHLDPFLSSYPPQSSPSLVSSPPIFIMSCMLPWMGGVVGATPWMMVQLRHRKGRGGEGVSTAASTDASPSPPPWTSLSLSL
jgi:hypothetical protein